MVNKLARGQLKAMLDASATIAFIAVCGAIVWSLATGRSLFPRGTAPVSAPAQAKARPPAPLPAEPVSLEGAVLKGNTAARIVVIEYSEFECPFCAKFTNETLPLLTAKYVDAGKVLWAFRNFPLERIHARAFRAAEAAACAGEQNRFWDMHRVLFENQAQLEEASLQAHAGAAGLDRGRFAQCMGGAMTARIRDDMKSGESLAVTGTPAFLIGRLEGDGRVRVLRRITGAQPASAFQQAIDEVSSSPDSARP